MIYVFQKMYILGLWEKGTYLKTPTIGRKKPVCHFIVSHNSYHQFEEPAQIIFNGQFPVNAQHHCGESRRLLTVKFYHE